MENPFNDQPFGVTPEKAIGILSKMYSQFVLDSSSRLTEREALGAYFIAMRAIRYLYAEDFEEVK